MSFASPCFRKRPLCGLLGVSLLACGGHGLGVRDAGGKLSDANADAETNTSLDASPDMGTNTGLDATPDAGIDTGPDANLDAGMDAGPDASPDVGSDAGSDAGIDLGGATLRLDAGVTVLGTVLPSPRHESAVFSDGQSLYIAGGLDDKSTLLSQVVRFAPSTGTLAVLPEVLPTPTYAAGVAWTGTAAYLIGGLDRNGALRQIVRYAPSTGAATIMSAQLPAAVYNVGAVWTGSAIYVFGGVVAGTHLTQILKYDPAADTLATLLTTLPVGIEAPAVFWDGSLAWILGGKADAAGSSGLASNAVQTFDPSSGQANLLGALPYAVWDAPAFGDGKVFYLAGGSATSTSGYTSILRVDPVARATSTLILSLPVHPSGRVGTWVASVGAGYICGGADSTTGKLSDKIIQVVP